jgi:hypothetical protein
MSTHLIGRMLVVALVTLGASSVAAQEQERAYGVPAVIKQVLLDPTTYAPSIVAWKATRLDWQTSQVFFEHGWHEHNSRFTISGLPDDVAIGYAEGNRRILTDAIASLNVSLINNVSSRVFERAITPHFPAHRKLIGALGWVERSAMASYLTYLLAAGHFEQWQNNEQRARQLAGR